MAIWVPSKFVRVKVLGLAWRGDELLLREVEDGIGRIKGLRPLGGCVEFGESREKALAREFVEELGCAITITGPWHAFENIFEHEGATGHEYLFAADISLADSALYERDRIAFQEADGMNCRAGWFSPVRREPGVDLYPEGLLSLIEAGVARSSAQRFA